MCLLYPSVLWSYCKQFTELTQLPQISINYVNRIKCWKWKKISPKNFQNCFKKCCASIDEQVSPSDDVFMRSDRIKKRYSIKLLNRILHNRLLITWLSCVKKSVTPFVLRKFVFITVKHLVNYVVFCNKIQSVGFLPIVNFQSQYKWVDDIVNTHICITKCVPYGPTHFLDTFFSTTK